MYINNLAVKDVYDLLDNSFVKEKIANEIILTNEKSEKIGLSLTKEEAYDLVETRSKSLKDNGLIEFDSGIITNIINEFYDSPYMSKIDYVENLNDLIDLFYQYRKEYGYYMNDETIIKIMRFYYDKGGSCKMIPPQDEEIIKRNLDSKHRYDWNRSLEFGEWPDE